MLHVYKQNTNKYIDLVYFFSCKRDKKAHPPSDIKQLRTETA